MRRFKSNIGFAVALPIALAALILSTLSIARLRHEHDITVDSKERVCSDGGNGGANCKYLVYTTDGDTFENVDELVWGARWKMDSSNMQAKLHVGSTYHIKTTGMRVPAASLYENIYAADLVETPAGAR